MSAPSVRRPSSARPPPFRAGAGVLGSGERVVGMSSTRTGAGYWVVTNRGRVVAFGDAPFLGDVSGLHLNAPMIGSVATGSGAGYDLLAADGGIFSFGDAAFF